MIKNLIKSVAVVTCIIFVFSVIPHLEGAEFFFQPRKGKSSTFSGEVGICIPFGHGPQPRRKSMIEQLKEEETNGAITGLGLVVLGACIVGAAVLIANAADDTSSSVVDTITEKAEDIADTIEDRLEELE